jgi:hypothetical protein
LGAEKRNGVYKPPIRRTLKYNPFFCELRTLEGYIIWEYEQEKKEKEKEKRKVT